MGRDTPDNPTPNDPFAWIGDQAEAALAGRVPADPAADAALERVENSIRAHVAEWVGVLLTGLGVRAAEQLVTGGAGRQSDEVIAPALWALRVTVQGAHRAGFAVGRDLTGFLRAMLSEPATAAPVRAAWALGLDIDRVPEMLRVRVPAGYAIPTVERLAGLYVDLFEAARAVAAERSRGQTDRH